MKECKKVVVLTILLASSFLQASSVNGVILNKDKLLDTNKTEPIDLEKIIKAILKRSKGVNQLSQQSCDIIQFYEIKLADILKKDNEKSIENKNIEFINQILKDIKNDANISKIIIGKDMQTIDKLQKLKNF